MNKTININLGGFFFHIDETAFQKLKRYLDSISRSLSDDPQGKNEIISDIEARISELLSEKITDARQVVNEADIDEIIVIMGQPEDYADAEEGYTETNYSTRSTNSKSKKLYRDGEDKFLGGVAAGIGHYLSIDTIWVRLIFLVLGFSGGFGIPLYIILWILLPEAKSTAEKLQMEGEPVNIDNIEKKIRDEFSSLSSKLKDGANELGDKISSADYDKLRNQTKSGLQDFLDTLGKIILVFFNIAGKFIGVVLMIIAVAVLISLVIGGFSLGSFEVLNIGDDFIHYPPFFYESMFPKWLLSILILIAIGIPFLILFILGLRILSSNIKRFSKTTSLTLLGIWIIAIFGLSFAGIEYGSTRAYDGLKITKNNLAFTQNDTINIKMINDDNLYYRHNFRRRSGHQLVDLNGLEKAYSNNVHIDVRESNTNNAYVKIRKSSQGKNRKAANDNASQIEYKYNLNDSEIILDGYFLSNYENLHKDESITATIYIPKGITIYFTNSTKYFLDDVKNTQDIYDRDMVNHYFKMTSRGFKCTDCGNENNDHYDDDRDHQKEKTNFKLNANDDGVQIEF